MRPLRIAPEFDTVFQMSPASALLHSLPLNDFSHYSDRVTFMLFYFLLSLVSLERRCN